MLLTARCRCGPPVHARSFTRDAAPPRQTNDPTGTMPLQQKFRKELDARWAQLRKMVPSIVVARTNLANTIAHSAATGQDTVKAFQAWFDKALKTLVVSDGRWMARYVREAGDAAILRATTTPGVDRVPPLQTLAYTELQGIAEAASQQAVRAYANGLLTRQTPAAIARAIQAVIDKVGVVRSNMLVSFIIVRTFSAVTLDAFRSAGVSSVGIKAERAVRLPTITRDAPSAKKSAQKSKKSKGKSPSSSSGAGGDDLVEVLTAGDNDVCEECQDISDDGPYTLDEAEDLIPAHPNCRCAFVPWGDDRFASVHEDDLGDAGSDDEPRDKDGKWTTGGAASSHDVNDPSLVAVPMSSNSPDFSKAVVAEHIKRGYQPEERLLGAKDFSKLRATQKELNAPDGEELQGKGAPFPSYTKYPVVERENGSGLLHIVDGHNRISSAVRSGKPIKVYQFQEADLEHNTLSKLRAHGVHDSQTHTAAGVMFLDQTGKALFLKRSDTGDHAGEWCFPGGAVEPGEIEVQTAAREAGEETGVYPELPMEQIDRRELDGVEFTTYGVMVPAPFLPTLNAEHTDYVWRRLDDPPQPLHPGVKATIDHAVLGDAGNDDEPRDDHGRWAVSVESGDGERYRGTHILEGTLNTGEKAKWIHNAQRFVRKTGEYQKRLRAYRLFEPIKILPSTAADEFDPNQPRDDHGQWSSGGANGGPELKSWTPPQSDAEWANVGGQDHTIGEPPLPNLKMYSYINSKNEKVEATQRLSSGVIMREKDGRTWIVKPTNGFGGYNYTFPKGGVEEGLHPQANAIKETYEETGLKARITGYAGDYKGDTGITRMYHAVREDGHPKDKGWETEKVRLAHPTELPLLLNRSRDKKIASHHIIGDEFDPNEPRDEHGQWTSGGGALGFSNTLKEGGVKHKVEQDYMGQTNAKAVTINAENHLPSLKAIAESNPDYSHTVEGPAHTTYVFGHTDDNELNLPHPSAEYPIDMQDLTKVSGKMGSNEGGVYSGAFGDKFYVKQPATPDHVTNELIAAKLYQLAGAKTLNYIPVKGGEHVATEMEDLAKKNVSQLDPAERDAAKSDFAVHAWIANWDAAGTGGDNIGVRKNGEVVTLDTGGSLKYRAQGDPKGLAFGDKVTETNTLRDPSKNYDAAKLYGDMTNEQMIASMKRVTNIPATQIWKTVTENGGGMDLAAKMVARQDDLKNQIQNMTGAKELAQQAQAAKAGAGLLTPTTPTPTTQTPEPTSFKTKLDHAKHLLLKGTTSEELKSKLGWPSISVPATAKSLNMNLIKTKVGGVFHYQGELMTTEQAKAAKAAAKSAAASTTPKAASAPAPAAAPPTGGHDINTPLGNFKQSLEEHGVLYQHGAGNSHSDYIDIHDPNHAKAAQEIAKWHPAVTQLSSETFEVAKAKPSSTQAKAAEASTKHPPATEAELAKAKKNVELQLQYVPGAPDVPAAHALIKEFNNKYAGKTITDPHDLQQKVNAFKDMTAKMIPLQSAQQQAHAALTAKSNAEAAVKNKALQEAAEAKKAAAKAAFEAKISDPLVKAQYDKLHSIGVSGAASLDTQFAHQIKKLSNTGHQITGADAAYISAYTGSAYDDLNESLWKGDKMNLKQSIYASALAKSLDKMPSYQGTAVRGVKTPGAFARYEENVGHVVTERGFSSYGATHKLWGSEATIHLTATDLKDIRSFNSHEGGGELILQKGSMIHITKVNKKTREVWAEQIG